MIFDTDVLLWFFDGDVAAAQLVEPETDRAISIVSLMEAMQGAKSKAEAAAIRGFLVRQDFYVIPIHEPVSYAAEALIEEHAHSSGLRLADALIAATAKDRGEVLATANVRHFRALAGLQIKPFRPGAGR